jgi:hypothetical protein
MNPMDKFAKYPLRSFLLCSLPLFFYPLTASSQPGTFMATGSMTAPRFQHTVTVLANGQVLVAGGTDRTSGGFDPVASAELYDPATGTFRATGAMSAARMDQTATLLPNGQVLIVGGNNPPRGETLTSAELYDPRTGTFIPTGSMTTTRAFFTATLLTNGKVLIAGGSAGPFALATAELYDPGTGLFTPSGSLVTARSGHYATLLANGQVLIAGGASGSAFNAPALASAELYDPTTGTFSLTGSMTMPRQKHNAVLLASGQVLVVGGTAVAFAALASAEFYDPTTGSFTPTGSMNTPRFFVTPTAVPLTGGQVLVAGGSHGGPVASAELYKVTITGPAPASGASCNGVYDGTFNGNLTVSPGQNCLFVSGGVTGNVIVTGGNLELLQSRVGGNVQVNGGGAFNIGPGSTIDGNLELQGLPGGAGLNQLCGSTVNGNVQFQNNGTAMLLGGSAPAWCMGNTIHGNLQVQNNPAATTMAGNTVDGNLLVDNNLAAAIATGNSIKGNLQATNNAAVLTIEGNVAASLHVTSNTGATQVVGNTVSGNLQCTGNSSIVGGPNTAKKAQGQCF